MSKVVHLSEPIHAEAKHFCQQRGLRMSEWVGQLIADACRAGGDAAAPAGGAGAMRVEKKPLQREAPAPEHAASPGYAAPPFWAETPA